eukprot:8374008-Lingulodinium_polyedra.AAC.1
MVWREDIPSDKQFHVASGQTRERSFHVPQHITYEVLAGVRVTTHVLGQFGNQAATLLSANDLV